MTLYAYLTENIIQESNDKNKICSNLETAAQAYFNPQNTDADKKSKLGNAIVAFGNDFNWTLKKDLDKEIVSGSAVHHIVLTSALLFCLKEFGLEDILSSTRHAFFNIDAIHSLALQNDCYMIRRMNALRYAHQKTSANEALVKRCQSFDHAKTVAQDLAQFYDQLADPAEDAVKMQRSLATLIEKIKKISKFNTESKAIEWLTRIMITELEADKWTYYSLIYDRLSTHSIEQYSLCTRASMPDSVKNELGNVETTHNKMNLHIKLQAIGMSMGGFTFGIEVGMLILEEAAEEDVLQAWHILLISAALCWTLGRRLGLFFFRAHIHELEKQSKENYYNVTYGNSAPKSSASATAIIGTGAEGLLVLFGLITSGMFTCDMIMMAVRNEMLGYNDEYKSDIFGTYFWNKMTDQGQWGYVVAVTCSLIIGLAAIGSAVSLTCGHYALDGKETKEYEEKQEQIKQMRCVA